MQRYTNALGQAPLTRRMGRITRSQGLVLEANGPDAFLGEVCAIYSRSQGAPVLGEVVGIRDGRVLLMPYGELHGIGLGSEVIARGQALRIAAGVGYLGRVVDAFGKPIDGMAPPPTHVMCAFMQRSDQSIVATADTTHSRMRDQGD